MAAVVVAWGDEKIKRKRGLGVGGWEVGLRDVVPGLEKEELTCPAVRPSVCTAGRTPVLAAAQCC